MCLFYHARRNGERRSAILFLAILSDLVIPRQDLLWVFLCMICPILQAILCILDSLRSQKAIIGADDEPCVCLPTSRWSALVIEFIPGVPDGIRFWGDFL